MIDSQLPVHFIGTVIGPSGFAGEGRQWLWALEHAGLEPSLAGYSLGRIPGKLTPAEQSLIQRCAARPKSTGGISFHHSLIPHFEPDPDAAVNLLKTLFETEGLPDGWAASANRADAVLVSTDFNQRTFTDAGVDRDRIFVLPPPFPSEAYRPRGTGEPRRGGPFRWLSVFDWCQRKGPDLLLAAFGRGFGQGEAELCIKVMPDAHFTRSQIEAHCIRQVQAAAGSETTAPEVRLIDGSLDQDEMLALYRDADGFVLPSRGEGWGRPVHEAMLMELPVVTSAGSALATLIPNASFGYPVLCRITEVSKAAGDEIEIFRGLSWHEPDPARLMHAMREVVANPVEARRRAVRGRQRMLAMCHPETISAALPGFLAQLVGQPVSA